MDMMTEVSVALTLTEAAVMALRAPVLAVSPSMTARTSTRIVFSA